MRLQTIRLDGIWRVMPESLACKGEKGLKKVKKARDGWIAAKVPGEIHLDLMRAEQMVEPLVSTNASKCRWPEKKSWWCRTTFSVSPTFMKHERWQLIFEGLDLYAQIFLNGKLLGEAANAFVPAVFDTGSLLKRGTNELVVRLTVGSELARDKERRKSSGGIYGNRSFPSRKWLRKPQFTYGWDWVDALPNIGIWRSVRLEGRSWVTIHDLRTDTHMQRTSTYVKVVATVENLHPWSERHCLLEVSIRPPKGKGIVQRIEMDSQVGYFTVERWIEIQNPKFWWPNGMGNQPLYRVTARVLSGKAECDRRQFDIGLRTVEIDRSRMKKGGSRFCIRVNGRDVFCKGGNWIPADAIIARVNQKKYEKLITEAKSANINMLRIWGGGIYEAPAFYEACDRAGILIWHDFMFACSSYPDDDPDFCRAVRAEAAAVVRALRHHPSIALWCGNNENIQGFYEWWGGKPENLGGTIIYNQILPEICRLMDPHRPYWPGSPTGGKQPNSETEGDCHWWGPGTMNVDIKRRIRHEVYDECRSRFVSEYGVIGPCHLDSVKQYLKPAERRIDARAWKIHTNMFEKETTLAGIRLHYADPEGLSIPEYILYGQMFQAIMYGHSIEALRFRKHDPHDDCQGALIWMYSDCWGEVGWTIIDYYLRRKPSYYWFRRACSPVKAIVRRRGRSLVTRVINDTLEKREAVICYGWMRVDGSDKRMKRKTLTMPRNSMTEVVREPVPSRRTLDPYAWIYVAYLSGERIEDAPSIWTLVPHRQLDLAQAEICIEEKGAIVEIELPVYCHGVHLNDHGRSVLSDNYFDLLPGVRKRIHRIGGNKLMKLRFDWILPARSARYGLSPRL